MYVCAVLLYFYILIYSASNGCKCVSLCLSNFSSVQLVLHMTTKYEKDSHEEMSAVHQWMWQLDVSLLLHNNTQPHSVTPSRRRLRSLCSSALLVPVTRRTTLGDRAFAVAGPRAWNTLPDFITDCSSSRIFKQYLKTYLFSLSFSAHNNTPLYDSVKRPSSSLCRLRRFKIVNFTLHCITLKSPLSCSTTQPHSVTSANRCWVSHHHHHHHHHVSSSYVEGWRVMALHASRSSAFLLTSV